MQGKDRAVVHMRSKAGPRVRVLTYGWPEYGLGYEDYVFSYPELGLARLDGRLESFGATLCRLP